MNRVNRDNHPQAGFSLLEVLIAFVILSLVLTMIFRVISGSLHNVSNADGYIRSLVLAESVMARLGTTLPLEEGEQSGEGHGLTWHLSVTPYSDATEDVEYMDWTAKTIPIYQVTVSVMWRQGNKRRELQLNSLRVSQQVEDSQ